MRIQSNKEEVQQQKEQDQLEHEKLLKTMYRASILGDIEIVQEKQRKQREALRAARIKEAQEKIQSAISEEEQARKEALNKASERWMASESTRSNQRKLKSRKGNEAAIFIQRIWRAFLGRNVATMMRLNKVTWRDDTFTIMQQSTVKKYDRKTVR